MQMKKKCACRHDRSSPCVRVEYDSTRGEEETTRFANRNDFIISKRKVIFELIYRQVAEQSISDLKSLTITSEASLSAGMADFLIPRLRKVCLRYHKISREELDS